jgi:predicted ATP-binding protein involved in virulence
VSERLDKIEAACGNRTGSGVPALGRLRAHGAAPGGWAMRIDRLKLENFRCFSRYEIELAPRFTLLIGDNGSGKSAMLDALAVAAGSFLLGVSQKGVEARNIKPDDVRLAPLWVGQSLSREEQGATVVAAEGEVDGRPIRWSRSLSGRKAKTNRQDARPIRDIARDMDGRVRAGKPVTLPVIAYYGSGRLFHSLRDRPTPAGNLVSRLAGYEQCLSPASDPKRLFRWFKTNELAALQKGEKRHVLEAVRKAIKSVVPGTKRAYWDLDFDELVIVTEHSLGDPTGYDLRIGSWGDGSEVPTSGRNLVIVGTDHNDRLHIRIFDASGNGVTDTDETKLPATQAGAISTLRQRLSGWSPPHVPTAAERAELVSEVTSIVGQTRRMRPFHLMSDGYRNLVGLAGNIAYRMATLNPHLLAKATSKTPGVVLIDELDLHCHPTWQRLIVGVLLRAFPRVQFVGTTHSPFIIQDLYGVAGTKLWDLNKGSERAVESKSIEDIAEDKQGVEIPQQSGRFLDMMRVAEEYYTLLRQSDDQDPARREQLKNKLDRLSSRYSDDPAFQAFLKQKRIAAGLNGSPEA